MKNKPIIGTFVVVALLLANYVRATTFTNFTYSFNNATGGIDTQMNVFASPALFSFNSTNFFDAEAGLYAVMISTTLPTTFQVCTNLIWSNSVSATTTTRVCNTGQSNITVTGRFKVSGSYPHVTRSSAVKSGP